MNFSRMSRSALFGMCVAWVIVVFVGWLFSPAGQTVILIKRLAREHPESFNAALPLTAMRLWTVAALVVAFVPVTFAIVGWVRARRIDRSAGRLTSA